jgi:hypothetical protein
VEWGRKWPGKLWCRCCMCEPKAAEEAAADLWVCLIVCVCVCVCASFNRVCMHVSI